MNPWNALLESLHSSLIDELTELAPEPKPELGLPARKNGFSLPSERISEVWAVPLLASIRGGAEAEGCAFLGLSPGAAQRLGHDAETLFARVLARASQQEFKRRSLSVAPRPGRKQSKPASPDVRIVIWFPLALGGEPVALGLGV